MTDVAQKKDFNRATSPPDDPLQRHEELNADRKLGSEGKPLTDLRLAALEHARKMPTTADIESVAPLAGASNWVQLGPTVIPKGQTYTSATVQVTGRITSIVVDPNDPNTIYAGAAQGGVWKTTDRGKTWNPKTDLETRFSIHPLPLTNPIRITAR